MTSGSSDFTTFAKPIPSSNPGMRTSLIIAPLTAVNVKTEKWLWGTWREYPSFALEHSCGIFVPGGLIRGQFSRLLSGLSWNICSKMARLAGESDYRSQSGHPPIDRPMCLFDSTFARATNPRFPKGFLSSLSDSPRCGVWRRRGMRLSKAKFRPALFAPFLHSSSIPRRLLRLPILITTF